MQEQFERINPFRIDVRETHARFVYFYDNNVDLLKGQNRARVHLSFILSGEASTLEFDLTGVKGEPYGK